MCLPNTERTGATAAFLGSIVYSMLSIWRGKTPEAHSCATEHLLLQKFPRSRQVCELSLGSFGTCGVTFSVSLLELDERCLASSRFEGLSKLA
jgi:hypothetical protein